ncbi:hypothetical protein AB4254_11455 [Vibrio breoganii]
MYNQSLASKELFRAIKEGNVVSFNKGYLNSEYINKTDCNADGNSLFGYAILVRSRDIALMLAYDVELLSMCDEKGRPPVHNFKKNLADGLIGELVGLGMDINARDSMGNGLPHVLARVGTAQDIAIAEGLGLDLDMRNERGETGADIAKRYGRLAVFNGENALKNEPTESTAGF